LGAVSYPPSIVTVAVSVAVCETFSVKEWRDLENQGSFKIIENGAVRYDTIRYDTVYLTCSKKLTGSQLSLPDGINKKLKCKPKSR